MRRKLVKDTLPERWTPKFMTEIDGRSTTVKVIKSRVRRLMDETGADSYQREILCERTAFISVQLETSERVAIEDGKFDAGVYGQLTNTLLGLLKSLGLEKRVKAAGGLKGYLGHIA